MITDGGPWVGEELRLALRAQAWDDHPTGDDAAELVASEV